ncbi:hypothetical protein GCM10017781_07030 [Deinococcus metalli]|uniref:Uncharacterized protein n=1 Tax=Deinococcus metalli TaxID=1141878 RepID=A0ABQ3JLB0_9DEIO|nr:hypothetical protein GCM10017781_07030 [Deinococcus metalli]
MVTFSPSSRAASWAAACRLPRRTRRVLAGGETRALVQGRLHDAGARVTPGVGPSLLPTPASDGLLFPAGWPVSAIATPALTAPLPNLTTLLIPSTPSQEIRA